MKEEKERGLDVEPTLTYLFNMIFLWILYMHKKGNLPSDRNLGDW